MVPTRAWKSRRSRAGPTTWLLALPQGSGPYLLSIGAGTGPDFNADGVLGCVDIDQLIVQIVSGGEDPVFDVTGDGQIDLDDVDNWLASAAVANGLSGAYFPGDANLDGKVDVNDLNVIGLSWLQNATGWCSGDFTADGVVNSGDLKKLGLHWLQDVSGAEAKRINARVPRAPLAYRVVAPIAATSEDSPIFIAAPTVGSSHGDMNMQSEPDYVWSSHIAKRYVRREPRSLAALINSPNPDFHQSQEIDQERLVDLVLWRW